jgi:hypothetical protein
VVHYHVYGYLRADSCPIRQSLAFKFQRKLLQVQLLELYLVYLQVQDMSGDANSITNVRLSIDFLLVLLDTFYPVVKQPQDEEAHYALFLCNSSTDSPRPPIQRMPPLISRMLPYTT